MVHQKFGTRDSEGLRREIRLDHMNIEECLYCGLYEKQGEFRFWMDMEPHERNSIATNFWVTDIRKYVGHDKCYPRIVVDSIDYELEDYCFR